MFYILYETHVRVSLDNVATAPMTGIIPTKYNLVVCCQSPTHNVTNEFIYIFPPTESQENIRVDFIPG